MVAGGSILAEAEVGKCAYGNRRMDFKKQWMVNVLQFNILVLLPPGTSLPSGGIS